MTVGIMPETSEKPPEVTAPMGEAWPAVKDISYCPADTLPALSLNADIGTE
jgi:hypothetical protein